MDWPIIIFLIICGFLLIKVIGKVLKIVIGLGMIILIAYFVYTNYGDSLLAFEKLLS